MPRIPVTELAKQVAAIEARLNRKPAVKGAKVCADIDLAPNTYFLRRPSGIIRLDIDTGGGLPAGGLTYLSGPDGAGKTFLLYKYIAMNQRLYKNQSAVALGVSEAAPDHFFMRRCGVQIRIPELMIEERQAERKQRGAPSFTKEELADFRQKTVGTVKLLRGANGEELLDALLDCFDQACFDILGLDSVSAVLPEAEAMKDLDESAKRAAAASMLTRFFQHYLNGTTGYYGLNPTTVVFTSQVRANSKKSEAMPHIAKYLPDFAPQGAWAAKHGKLLDILVKNGAKEKVAVATGQEHASSLGQLAEQTEQKKKRMQVGKTINYEILKGKAGVHEGIAGEFDFEFAHGTFTDDQRMIILQGLQSGIVEEREGLVTFYDPTTEKPFDGLKGVASIDKLATMMREDFALELALRRAVLSAAGIECAYG